MASDTDRPDRADRYEAAAVFVALLLVVLALALFCGAAAHQDALRQRVADLVIVKGALL